MPSNHTINYIELPAIDLDKAKSFYTDVFGWQFQDYGPDYCAFNDGHMDGGFFRAEQTVSTAKGTALVVLYAGDLEATRDTVIKYGGTITQDIFSFPGGRRFHFTDLNGNEMAVWSE